MVVAAEAAPAAEVAAEVAAPAVKAASTSSSSRPCRSRRRGVGRRATTPTRPDGGRDAPRAGGGTMAALGLGAAPAARAWVWRPGPGLC